MDEVGTPSIEAPRVMKSPRNVDIDITSRCNLRCKYCYHFDSAGDVDRDLPTEEWLRFFEELGRCSVIGVGILGGEPFLRQDILEIIDGIVRNRLRFVIVTNGTLITNDIASYLASTNRCDSVQLSVDGSSPRTHDECRGAGTFHRAVEGIRCLQRNGVRTSVRMTISKYNVKDLDETAKFLLEDLGLPEFSTNSADYQGLCRSNKDLVQLSVEDRSYAMQRLMELNAKNGGRISATAGPLAQASAWLEMETARQNGLVGKGKGGYLGSCGSVFSKIAVRSDGAIIPCSLMSHLGLGRINRDGLVDIWKDHEELDRLRERRRIPLSRFQLCNGCEYIPSCLGGCPAVAYSITGTDEHPNPEDCLRQFLQNGGRLPEKTGPTSARCEQC